MAFLNGAYRILFVETLVLKQRDAMNKTLVLGVTAAMLLPLAVSAAGHRKPGLWDTTVQMNFIKGGPQIPPDQLAKMQQMGIKLPMMGGEPHTFKHCVTPEEAAKDDHPETGNGDCQMQNQKWSGDSFSADMICHGRQGDMHGNIKASFSNDSTYTATTHMEGTSPHMGGDFAMESQISAKWLGADCGSVPAGSVR